MRPQIDGSVALVTGASSGIGAALARRLAPRVRVLVLVARRGDRLEALADELRAQRADLVVECQPCDLADPDALEQMGTGLLERHGSVDVLINNAGFGDFSIFDLGDWKAQQQLIAVNIHALTQLTSILTPAMVRNGRGAILNVSSGVAYMFLPGMSLYTASKHFVTAFTEGLRLELAPAGVVVCQTCPGPVKTEFMGVAGATAAEDQPPAFILLGVDACAQQTLAGFERGKAVILPGAMNKLTVGLISLIPRFVLRMVLAPFARSVRRKQELPGG